MYHYEQALELQNKTHKVNGSPYATIHKSLGNLYTRFGENEKAAYLLQLAADSIGTDEIVDKAFANSDLARAYWNSGNYKEATNACERALALLQANYPDTLALVLTYNVLGESLLDDGKTAEAEQALKKAFRYLPDPTNPDRFGVLRTLGRIYLKSGRFPEAKEVLTQAVAFDASERRELAKAHTLLGWAELGTGNYENALENAQLALQKLLPSFISQDVESNPAPELLATVPDNSSMEALDLKSETFWRMYRENHAPQWLSLADTTATLALEVAHRLTEIYQFESSKLAGTAKDRRLYNRQMQILYALWERDHDPGTLDKALAFADNSRASILKEKLTISKALESISQSDSLAIQEKKWRYTLIDLNDQLTSLQLEEPEKHKDAIQQLEREILLANDARQKLIDTLMAPFQGGKNQWNNRLQVEQIRQKVAPQNGLWVEYFLDEDSSYLYSIGISREKAQFERVPFQGQEISDFLKALSNVDIAENQAEDPEVLGGFIRQSRTLYEKMLAPVIGGIPEAYRHITIVPDGATAILPYDLLLYREPETAHFRDLPYLVLSSSVRLAFSAELDLQLDREVKNTPKFEGRFLGIAPDYTGTNLPPVSAGVETVRTIDSLLGGETLLAGQATASAFLAMAPRYQTVFFQGHAIANDNLPSRSRLVFSNPDRTGTDPDYSVFAYQLYNTPFHTQLMILAGCETGLGKISLGEGNLSLSRAFSTAGCPSTVMSLWKIQDRATGNLMSLFLENIHSGLDKDEALRLAKVSYLENRSHNAHPYYWGSFVLMGDSRPVVWKKTNYGLIIALGLGLLILGGALFYRRKV